MWWLNVNAGKAKVHVASTAPYNIEHNVFFMALD